MTYEEFTALAKRKITTEEYYAIVEPVYNYHPAIPNKKTAAKLYDLCGLQAFRDMRATADSVARLDDTRPDKSFWRQALREWFDEYAEKHGPMYWADADAAESGAQNA